VATSRRVKGIAFDMYGTLVDVGAVAEACKEIVFVSSNSFDVVGAKSFGFKVCWINRTGAPLDRLGVKPDLLVRSSDELAAAIPNARLLTVPGANH